MRKLKHLNEYNIFSDFEEEFKPDINTLKEGDEVIMINMPEDPDPIKAGTKGVIIKVQPSLNNIYVEWEDGRTLNLLYDVDEFTVIPKLDV